MRIIGITGNARHGKDTLCGILTKLLVSKGVVVESVALSAPLKKLVVSTLNMKDVEELDYYKNSKKLYNGYDIRECLISTGDTLKYVYKDYFHVIVSETIDKSEADVVIIPDVRMLDELEYLKNKYDLLLIKVTNNRVVVDNSHVTESEVKLLKEDVLVENNGTMEELYNNVETLIPKLGLAD